MPYSMNAAGKLHSTRLQLPKGSLARFHYLELEWETLQGDGFRITDSAHRTADPRAWIAFKSVRTPEPVRYRVPWEAASSGGALPAKTFSWNPS